MSRETELFKKLLKSRTVKKLAESPVERINRGVLIAIACQTLLDNMSQLADSELWDNDVFRKTKSLHRLLIAYTDAKLWNKKRTVSESDIIDATDRIIELSILQEKIVSALSVSHNIGNFNAFSKEVGEVALKHGIDMTFLLGK